MGRLSFNKKRFKKDSWITAKSRRKRWIGGTIEEEVATFPKYDKILKDSTNGDCSLSKSVDTHSRTFLIVTFPEGLRDRALNQYDTTRNTDTYELIDGIAPYTTYKILDSGNYYIRFSNLDALVEYYISIYNNYPDPKKPTHGLLPMFNETGKLQVPAASIVSAAPIVPAAPVAAVEFSEQEKQSMIATPPAPSTATAPAPSTLIAPTTLTAPSVTPFASPASPSASPSASPLAESPLAVSLPKSLSASTQSNGTDMGKYTVTVNTQDPNIITVNGNTFKVLNGENGNGYTQFKVSII